MFTIACCVVAGLGQMVNVTIRVRIRYSVSMVKCYAHVFVLLSNVNVTLSNCFCANAGWRGSAQPLACICNSLPASLFTEKNKIILKTKLISTDSIIFGAVRRLLNKDITKKYFLNFCKKLTHML